MPFYAVNPSNGQVMRMTDDVILLHVDNDVDAGPEGAVNDYLLGDEYTEQGVVAFHGTFRSHGPDRSQLSVIGAADELPHLISGY